MDPKKFWEQYHVLDVESKYLPDTDSYEVDKLIATLQGKSAEVAAAVKEKSGIEIDEDQVKEAIVLGKSKALEAGQRFIKDTTTTAKDMVLVRDWFARELEDLANAEKSKAAVVVQSVYRGFHYAESYANLKDTSDAVIPLFRGALERLKFYEKKWVYVQINGRSRLHGMIRASMRRSTTDENIFNYYSERAKLFYDINTHRLQDIMYATVQRQKYYEKKLKFCEKENAAKETIQMIKYDHFATKYMAELNAASKIEADEAAQMKLEEDYTREVKFMQMREIFTQQGERQLLNCEMLMRRAAHAVEGVKKTEGEMFMREARYVQYHDQIEAAAKRKCVEVMIRLGVQSAVQKTFTSLPLIPLPADDDYEGLHNYFKYHVRETAAGRLAGAVADANSPFEDGITYDTDLKTRLNTQQQRLFVTKIAELIDVDEEDLVLHMTPRTPGRKPDYNSYTYQGQDAKW